MQIDIKHAHDSLFKNVFDNIKNTKDFLKAYLPDDLVKQIDFRTMKEASTEKLDLEAQKNYFDLCVECKTGKEKSKFYILFEHKSYNDKQTLMQILRYCLVSWENELRNNKKHLTPIIPFIFYHGKYKSGFHENFRDYFEVDESLRDYLLDFKTIVFDTTKIEDSEIREKINHNMFLMSSVLLMKNIFGNNLKPIMKTITELKGDKMPSLAEIWMERGEKRGKEIGKEIGKKIGEERGRLNELYDSVKMGLDIKFQEISDKLFLNIQKIKEIDKLKEIQKALFVINDANEFAQFVQKRV